jgi:hypothetical protein
MMSLNQWRLPTMTDKRRKPNFGVLVQVARTQDDTKAEGKHFTSFMLIKTI